VIIFWSGVVDSVLRSLFHRQLIVSVLAFAVISKILEALCLTFCTLDVESAEDRSELFFEWIETSFELTDPSDIDLFTGAPGRHVAVA
jgi:hypothetical protein